MVIHPISHPRSKTCRQVLKSLRLQHAACLLAIVSYPFSLPSPRFLFPRIKDAQPTSPFSPNPILFRDRHEVGQSISQPPTRRVVL